MGFYHKNTKWNRVTVHKACPVCGKTSWCSVSADGEICVCMRVREGCVRPTANGGFLHQLSGNHERPSRTMSFTLVCSVTTGEHRNDMTDLADVCRRAGTGRIDDLARRLGVTGDSLRRLDVGRYDARRAWSFPMSDAAGQVVGIRLRGNAGKKFAVPGGREGLFLPSALPSRPRTLFVCEGPTDCAALLDLGLHAVGRPSCTGGQSLVVNVVKELDPGRIVILADADDAGRRGAEALASVLAVYCRDLRLVMPPEGVKDAREWKAAGASAATILAAADAARPRTITAKFRFCGGKDGRRGH